MDTTFEEIYNIYSYNECNNIYNTFNHRSKTNNNKYSDSNNDQLIQKFFHYLFGNHGRNLRTVLSCGVKSELESIYHMLGIYDVKQYLILSKLLRDDYNTIDTISSIVMNIHCNNYSNNIVKNIAYNIRYLVLMYKFDTDYNFYKIYDKYSEATEAKNYQMSNVPKNTLVYSFGVHPTFRQIHHKYLKAIQNEDTKCQKEQIK